MKELPIRFSGPMVKAILDGSKTQTRRVVKQDRDGLLDCKPTPAWDAFWQCVACPYGKPGDRLWVRETFGIDDEDWAVLYFADPDTAQNAEHARICEDRYPRRRPSIHMPRWASRILLEITDVRVERLQDISEGQAVDEGLIWEGVKDGQTYWNHTDHRYPPGSHQQLSVSGTDAVSAFRNLWKSTGGDWQANPWVWVVEFKRVTP